MNTENKFTAHKTPDDPESLNLSNEQHDEQRGWIEQRRGSVTESETRDKENESQEKLPGLTIGIDTRLRLSRQEYQQMIEFVTTRFLQRLKSQAES